jgi:Fe-S cluster biogenesis protein NfuA/nitrite reductase/ring-hydroxylating ferredoxin subunit
MTGVRAASVHEAGARVEELLAALRDGACRDASSAAAAAEELVGLLVSLYGEGLRAIVTILADQGQPGQQLLARLADDPQVEGLLLLHDLHPLDTDARIQRALDRVRPYLGSHAGGVEYLGVSGGVARLRLAGSCHGCPSSAATVELAITSAVQDAAPEVTQVTVEGMTAPPAPALLQIGKRPDNESLPAGNGPAWVLLPPLGPPSSRPVSAVAAGVPVVLCAVRGTLYAYRDSCPACGSPLAGGTLDREVLTCPGCGARYDARRAGQSLADDGTHLDPLPLLADSEGVRIAVPDAVAS